MRYASDHNDQTRTKIVDVASGLFRERGIPDTGIALIMKSAGLTNGAFYTHFSGKSELVREAVSTALVEQCELFEGALLGGAGFEELVRAYLSPDNRDVAREGCASAALIADVGRGGSELRATYAAKLDVVVGLIARSLGGPSEENLATGMMVYASLIGTLQLARASTTVAKSDTILENGVIAALAIAGRASAA